jgi:hypothetical protein
MAQAYAVHDATVKPGLCTGRILVLSIARVSGMSLMTRRA